MVASPSGKQPFTFTAIENKQTCIFCIDMGGGQSKKSTQGQEQHAKLWFKSRHSDCKADASTTCPRFGPLKTDFEQHPVALHTKGTVNFASPLSCPFVTPLHPSFFLKVLHSRLFMPDFKSHRVLIRGLRLQDGWRGDDWATPNWDPPLGSGS